MQIHQLKSPKGSRKRRQRAGRGPGSNRGKTSGRGENGQGSREGRSTVMGFEGGQMSLIRRLPKVGFTNLNATKYQVVSVGSLEKFRKGDVVDSKALKEANLISSTRKPYKILNNGELKKSLTVKAQKFSKKAEEQIVKAGGKAEVVKLGADVNDQDDSQ